MHLVSFQCTVLQYMLYIVEESWFSSYCKESSCHECCSNICIVQRILLSFVYANKFPRVYSIDTEN